MSLVKINQYKHLTFLQHTNHKVNSHWISAACCQEIFKNRRADICYLYLVKNASSGLAIEFYKAKKYRKNKKIYIIEAIQLVELASSLHAS